MKSYFLNEPDLIFSNFQPCCDPRVGLLNFAPYGLEEPIKIPLGIIGTKHSVLMAKNFLNRLKFHIPGVRNEKSNTISIDFPGNYSGGPLKYEFELSEENCILIDDELKKKILEQESRWKSIITLADIIEEKFQLIDTYPKPLILLPLDEEITSKCKDPRSKKTKLRIGNRTYRYLKYLSTLEEAKRPKLIDFHHYIKVLGFKNNITSQIILPDTLQFSSEQNYDPATVAWNFSSALYYKSTKNPWKVADINPDTIHVGISFYLDLGTEDNVIKRASMAQIYMKNAESQVIRGLEIPVQNEIESKKTNLTFDQSKYLIQKAIKIFKETHNGTKPTRLVVHKSSPFDQKEIDGIDTGAENIEIKNMIHIKQNSNFRPLSDNDQPLSRGTVFESSSNGKIILNMFTTGYIPCYDTYMGSTVPEPLEIVIEDKKSIPRQIAEDIMKLTKLDWNSTDFCTRMPCTISVSRKVGKIMGELHDNNIEPPAPYCFYM